MCKLINKYRGWSHIIASADLGMVRRHGIRIDGVWYALRDFYVTEV